MGLADVIGERGGFATRRELLALGATDRMLTAAVRSGLVRRARNGWYSTAESSDPRFRAVALGGRLTGLSAFAWWGAWVWQRPSRVRVAVPANAARLRPVRDVHVSYGTDADRGTPTVVSLVEASARAVLDEPLEIAVPCLDWALATGRMDRVDLEGIMRSLPQWMRVAAAWVDGRSQSVLESVARVRLRSAGYRVLSQQRTGDFGALDLLVEQTVALELDGRVFHESSFERDRRRDLVSTVEGRHVIRISTGLLRDEWPTVIASIEAALTARGVEKSGVAPQLPRGSRRRSVG
jgi:very-short-patch-repair endonuclease